MEPDGDRPIRVVDVPERPLAVLQEPPRSDHAGQIAAHPHPVVDLVRLGRRDLHPGEMLQRHLELALEGEELVRAPDVHDEVVGGDLDVCHGLSIAAPRRQDSRDAGVPAAFVMYS